MTIEIPVKLHVENYLRFRYRQYPYNISTTDAVGVCLYALLMPKPRKKYKYTIRKRNFKMTTFSVRLNRHKGMGQLVWLSPYREKLFNDYVSNMMWEELLGIIAYLKLSNENVNIDRIIKDFEKKYSLADTNLGFDTLKRRYYRYVKNNETLITVGV